MENLGYQSIEKHNDSKVNFRHREFLETNGIYRDNAALIIDEALTRGYDVNWIGRGFYEISNGKKSVMFEDSNSGVVPQTSWRMCDDKYLTKIMLSENGVPVPDGKLFYSDRVGEIIDYTRKFDRFVIKPNSGYGGKDVFPGISTLTKDYPGNLERILSNHFSDKREVLIEEFVDGIEYGVFVAKNGKSSYAAIRRRPSNIMGDGVHPIHELVDLKNQNREEGNSGKLMNSAYVKIKLDEAVKVELSQKGMDFDYVPSRGESVILRRNSNLSTGGDAYSIDPMKFNPKILDFADKSIEAIPGLRYSRSDVVVEGGIKNPKRIVFLEVNSLPGIKGMHHPYVGPSQNVAGAILDVTFDY